MPISLPKNTDSSGTAAASTSITLFDRSSAIVPTACPASSSVRKNTPNTAMNPAACCPATVARARVMDVSVGVLTGADPSRCTRTAPSASAARYSALRLEVPP